VNTLWNVITEPEVRQLIVVQGSRISAGVYLFIFCVCNAQEVPISGHEPLIYH